VSEREDDNVHELLIPEELHRPHLADSTVWSKVRHRAHPELARWFNASVRDDLVLTCHVVVLELLRSARNDASFLHQSEQLELLRSCPIDGSVWLRAREVQPRLSARGEHRGVPPADLVIAAAAEQAGVPLLHYDHDFDRIVAVTSQPARWLLPAGQLP
jgi:predicted nucleic acid-binding protein